MTEQITNQAGDRPRRTRDITMDGAFAPYLLPGERLLQVAAAMEPPNILLMLLSTGIYSLFIKYYIVGLTSQRLLLLPVKSRWNPTPSTVHELSLEELDMCPAAAKVTGKNVLVQVGLFSLVFGPMDVDQNFERAQEIAGVIGSGQAQRSCQAAQPSRLPFSVSPFRFVRAAWRFSAIAGVAIMAALVLVLLVRG